MTFFYFEASYKAIDLQISLFEPSFHSLRAKSKYAFTNDNIDQYREVYVWLRSHKIILLLESKGLILIRSVEQNKKKILFDD